MSIRRATETNERGLQPKIEFLALHAINKLGKLGRMTQTVGYHEVLAQTWMKVLQWTPSEQSIGQKWAEF